MRPLPHIKDPIWKGPSVDGVTQSLMTKFLQCPYEFYMGAIMGLRRKDVDPNLIWGDAFHIGLEHYLEKGNKPLAQLLASQRLKELEAETGIKVAYGQQTVAKMLEIYDPGYFNDYPEIKTEISLDSERDYRGLKIKFRGKTDVLGANSKEEIIGDHKAKGKFLDVQSLMRETTHNLQVNLYCDICDVYTFIYDVVRIPLTQYRYPPRKVKEKLPNYIERVFTERSNIDMYPIERNKRAWFSQWIIRKTKDEVQACMNRTILPIAYRMQLWFDHVMKHGPNSFNELHFCKPLRMFDPSYSNRYKTDFYEWQIGQDELEDYPKIDTAFPELDTE